MRIAILLLASLLSAAARSRPVPLRFEATANSVSGVTAKGTVTHEGIVAADPAILPLGSRIRVTGAAPYNGIYVVTDTGAKVAGRKIDIYLHSPAAARRFGKKRVTVRVLSRGNNRKNGREITPKQSAAR